MNKIRIYHFHNGHAGGVHSVIANLVRFSTNPGIENHVIYTINKDITPSYTFIKIDGTDSEQVFYYSPNWNFYHTCRQLAALLPDDKAVVVAHDWIELGMMSNLGLQNPVIQFLHGDYDYYYELAKMNGLAIDFFIAVADNIAAKLGGVIPHRKMDIAYLRFPVPPVPLKRRESKECCNIIFIGRPTAAKGYPLLPLIAKKIRQANIQVNWHIVAAPVEMGDDDGWNENDNVKFYRNITNEEVISLLTGMQILILPSLAEGMPVVIIEGMKAGVIPIVNDIDGGMRELVINNETGYRIPKNDVDDYVGKIRELTSNKRKMLAMQNNCIQLANNLFDPVKNTSAIEAVFLRTASGVKKIKSAQKIYGSRLDTVWIPNWATKIIRGFYK